LFGAPLSSYIADADLSTYVPHVDRLNVILVSIPLMIVASIATHLTARHNVTRNMQNPAMAGNPQTAFMNKITLYVFPLGVLAFGAFLQLGLLFYWLSNNAWTLGQQYVVYRRIDAEREAEKNAEEQRKIERRNNLAPKPGQKPMQQVRRPAKPQDAVPATEPSDTVADKAPERPDSSSNGTSAPTDGAVNGSGESTKIPGLAPDRARKKQSRKRR
jgi:YidC/Oxa1 family membrane protein insertase